MHFWIDWCLIYHLTSYLSLIQPVNTVSTGLNGPGVAWKLQNVGPFCQVVGAEILSGPACSWCCSSRPWFYFHLLDSDFRCQSCSLSFSTISGLTIQDDLCQSGCRYFCPLVMTRVFDPNHLSWGLSFAEVNKFAYVHKVAYSLSTGFVLVLLRGKESKSKPQENC